MAESEEIQEALREEFRKQLDDIADIYAVYEFRKKGANALKAIAEIAAKLNGERYIDAKLIKEYQEALKARAKKRGEARAARIREQLGGV